MLDSPLQAYRLTPTEYVTIRFAQDMLVKECMADFGFAFEPHRPFEQELQVMLEAERSSISRIYGITDAESAAQYGYGLPPVEDSAEAQATWSEAFELVLGGGKAGSPGEIDGVAIPNGGCLGQARRELPLGSEDESSFGLAHDLWLEGGVELRGGQEYRAVVQDWVDCLAEDGYRVTAPTGDEGDIRDTATRVVDPESPGSQAPASQKEIQLAVADVACKQEVGLVERLNEIRRGIDSQLVEDNQLALQEDRARLDALVKEATEIVSKTQ